MAAAADEGLTPRLLALGDAAWTVEFGADIDPGLFARVLGLQQRVQQARASGAAPWQGVGDVVPTFRSLTVHYDPLVSDGAALGTALLTLAQQAEALPAQGRRWCLPACFEPPFAPDLPALAHRAGLSEAQALRILLQSELHVYQLGFLPGLPYMGGVPPVLHAPRLAVPRTAVPAGSVALAGAMCTVYPWESPGGWHLVGRTPVPMFDLRRTPPALLASGDTVRWHAIDPDTFVRLQRQAQGGTLDLRPYRDDGGARG